MQKFNSCYDPFATYTVLDNLHFLSEVLKTMPINVALLGGGIFAVDGKHDMPHHTGIGAD